MGSAHTEDIGLRASPADPAATLGRVDPLKGPLKEPGLGFRGGFLGGYLQAGLGPQFQGPGGVLLACDLPKKARPFVGGQCIPTRNPKP